MSDREHERLGEIFLRARELDYGSRGRFLDEACAGVPELRARVESLLANDELASEVLGRLVTGEGTASLPPCQLLHWTIRVITWSTCLSITTAEIRV